MMLMTAGMITKATSFDEYDLKCILKDSGYDGIAFESAEFVGLSENAQFVYQVTFQDDMEDDDELQVGQVYVKYVDYGKFLADF